MGGEGGIAEEGAVGRAALGLAAELLERLRDPSLRQLEVRRDGVRVTVSKEAEAAAAAMPEAPPSDAVAEPPAAPKPAQPAKPATRAVTAPLTGIFYRSPSPQAGPFVHVGSVLRAGDVVGLIEAMKLFNEVRTAVAGRVRRIVAESGQVVRAHQTLVELD